MAKIKVRKYQGSTNFEIADAILDMSENILKACGSDPKLKELVISLAVSGWNISLYEPAQNNYEDEVEKNLPKNISKEYFAVFKNFLLKFIEEKRKNYPGLLKGITSHTVSFDNGQTKLTVHTLPVKPV
jgi:hypothetical protein